MFLTAGDKLGPYEIVALIGAGGMGEVYKARDPRVGRDVAVKVSAAQFTERFEREARAIAALNHPNICTLFDVGPNFLVMEYVEGEAPKGPLPLDEVLRIGKQIAEALSEAHEKGITHRDLKPGNIKIKPDGTVKVLDFGLAKMAAPPDDAPQGQATQSPTLSMAATQAGVILGTAAYMAPEQAKGKPVDKRADIWAFGVVLYEMLTGDRLFQHDDVTETLAAVVMKVPELERAPVEVRRVLKKCLEKDPKNRLRDIGDVWELLDAGSSGAPEMPLSPKARATWIPWALAGVLLIALAVALAWMFRPSLPLSITRFPVTLGEGLRFTNTGRHILNLSSDGTQMVYVANQRLFLRSMSELEARAIPGTDLGSAVVNPVFSPDGKSLAFYSNADQTLKRVAVSGGAPVTICPLAPAAAGISWSPDGIVFAQPGKGILRVSPDGGQPELLVAAKDGEQVENPQMLPGGEAILFSRATGSSLGTAAWDKGQVVVQTLKSGVRKTVVEGGSDARYLPTGHLVYALNGILFALPFDPRRQVTSGGPVGIVEGVARGNTGAAQFAFSSTGSLIYIPGPVSGGGAGQNVLAEVDRKGEVQPLNVPPATYGFPRASRDGKRVAYQNDDARDSSIWIYELSGGAAPRRLTLPGTGNNRFPIWSPDNERVAFQSDREGDVAIWWQRADGNGAAERLTKPEKGVSHIPDSWSPDAQRFSFTSGKENTASVWVYSLVDKKAALYAEIRGFVGRSVFSPDGKWIAYQVNDSQGTHNFIQTYPPTATKYQLPPDGNDHHPAWSLPDGKELFYIGGAGILGSVSITLQPAPRFGTPVRAPNAGFQTLGPGFIRTYDVLPDGKHFIGAIAAGQTQSGQATQQIQVVLNWFEDLKRRVPGR